MLHLLFKIDYNYSVINFLFVYFQVLVDGPETKVPRQAISLNDLRLTKFSYKFWHLGSTKELRDIWKKEDIVNKWKDTKWAKNGLAKKKVSVKIKAVLSTNVMHDEPA